MSYNNLSAVATLNILAALTREEVRESQGAHPQFDWAAAICTLEAAPEGADRLFVFALSHEGPKGSEARQDVWQVGFTWRESVVFEKGREARDDSRSFQVVTLFSADTPWTEVVRRSPVGGLGAILVEEDLGFGLHDRYTWLRGNPRQEWTQRSLEACLREAADWRSAADRRLGEYPWGACNSL